MKGGIDIGRSLLFFAIASVISLIVSLGVGLPFFSFSYGFDPAKLGPYDAERLEHEIFLAMNECRIKSGLPPLEYDQRLATFAREHSIDMAERNYYSHTTPEGITFKMRLKLAGFSLRHRYGETLFKSTGYCRLTFLWNYEGTAKEVVQGWYNSFDHQMIMLSPDLKRVGIGVALADTELYVTADYSD